MTVRVELDAFERQYLVCEICHPTTQKLLERVRVKRQWVLRCTTCHQEWAEQTIRLGKAVGIYFIEHP